MRTPELIRTIDVAVTHLATCSDELRDLDAALGDGDLGITVSAGSAAVIAACESLAEDATPAAVLRTAATAFADANPSTMAALVGGALLAAARAIGEVQDVDLRIGLTIGTVAAQSIATRGRSHVGEKTILDAIVPALAAMESTPDDPLAAGIQAAREGVERTRSLQSMRGRASWLGERSKGLQDPGATAFLRFLEGLDIARRSAS
ncbi:MAG TPA: DAK2 domain-containing protein [Cellulomonadaceae bacterium]|nr:DAK2 domain-containing protein [Cellulomonadaceae bacterium]